MTKSISDSPLEIDKMDFPRKNGISIFDQPDLSPPQQSSPDNRFTQVADQLDAMNNYLSNAGLVTRIQENSTGSEVLNIQANLDDLPRSQVVRKSLSCLEKVDQEVMTSVKVMERAISPIVFEQDDQPAAGITQKVTEPKRSKNHLVVKCDNNNSTQNRHTETLLIQMSDACTSARVEYLSSQEKDQTGIPQQNPVHDEPQAVADDVDVC